MEKTIPGETGEFLRGRRRFVSQAVPEIEPIPLRPPGFFANAAGPAVIREDNRLSKASVIRPPRTWNNPENGGGIAAPPLHRR